MSLETFNSPVAPSPGTGRKPEIKLLEVEFGDGYTAEGADGINSIRKTFDLRWDVLTYGQAASIEDFLTRHGGTEPFLYQHPNTPAPIRVKCKTWNQTDGSAGLCSFTATFKQSFNLDN